MGGLHFKSFSGKSTVHPYCRKVVVLLVDEGTYRERDEFRGRGLRSQLALTRGFDLTQPQQLLPVMPP
jgi:hypothetical protein